MSVLREFRTRHALTQDEASRLVGVQPGTWGSIERGARGWKPNRPLLRLLAALDALAAAGLPWPHDPRERDET